MAGERVHHERLSPLFNNILILSSALEPLERTFSANQTLALVLLLRSEMGEKRLVRVVS